MQLCYGMCCIFYRQYLTIQRDAQESESCCIPGRGAYGKRKKRVKLTLKNVRIHICLGPSPALGIIPASRHLTRTKKKNKKFP